MELIGVGIDTARYGHRVSFLDENRQPAAPPLTAQESREGYEQLEQSLRWLHQKHPQATFCVRIDAAGQYATNLESFLRGLKLPISLSVGQPKQNKDYQQVHFPKRKSDDTESHAMARYAVVERPAASPEATAEFLILRKVASRLESQTRQTTRAVNQLHNLLSRVFPELALLTNHLAGAWALNVLAKYPTPEKIARAQTASLEKLPYVTSERARQVQEAARRSVASLRGEVAATLVEELVTQLRTHQKAENRLRKLLIQAYQALPASAHVQVQTIVGIGPQTAAALVAKVVSIDRFDAPGKLVSYFGFFPEESSSGVDKQGRPLPPGTRRMSRKGNDLVRAYLWMAAKSAIVHNPAIRALYRRQRAQGKRGDVALGHCVRKLLHLVYAVWKTNRPFNPEHYAWETHPAQTGSPEAAHEKAAGLKPEVLQTQKEVTTATPTVRRSAASVNRPRSSSPARGVDYAFLRQQITIEQVLKHLGHWEALRGNGQQLRGPCPLHPSEKPGERTFSVNVPKNLFRCFHGQCQAAGNALDLWAAYHRLPLYEAAVSLAQAFGLPLNREEEPVMKRRPP
jgi:transposase